MADQFVQFDKGKPFYEMVGTFLCILSASPAIFNSGNPMGFQKEQYISLQGVQVSSKHWYPSEVYEQAQSGHMTQAFFIGHTCMMLANLAYESVKHLNDRSPEFEFFRHVRNAASHNNLFTFIQDEPRRPVAWRGVTIDHNRKGTSNPLHGTHCFGPILGPADIIDLLADIEQKIAT